MLRNPKHLLALVLLALAGYGARNAVPLSAAMSATLTRSSSLKPNSFTGLCTENSTDASLTTQWTNREVPQGRFSEGFAQFENATIPVGYFVSTESDSSKSDKASKKEPPRGLTVNFSLAAKKGGRRYRRPYVAVWLEDNEGFPVKTAVLWLQTSAPGPRWHRDLTRWYRNDRIRKLTEKTDLIDAVSGATRGPGDYSAYFDGNDNSGKRLEPGKYTLCIEVAREHGTYQIIRESIEWGDKAIEKKQLKPNAEVSAASYFFIPTDKVQ